MGGVRCASGSPRRTFSGRLFASDPFIGSWLKMASLVATTLTRSIRIAPAARIIIVQSRNCGWIKDWKPGPPPKTEEERIAAAKKYNLIPEDYETYDETWGTGDYPKLPIVSQDARDPYDDFDYHYHRSNYGETYHINYDIYTSDRYDPNLVTRYTPLQMYLSFFGFFFGMLGMFWIHDYYDIRISQPLKPKQYPGPEKVHYTFEPAD